MLKEMLKPENVFVNIETEGTDKEEALTVISSLCAKSSGIAADVLAEAYMKREELDSTGFGDGIAIPHAKIKGLTNPMVAIGKFAKPIEWGAIDDKPVTTVIALIMPDGDEDNIHLQVISKFARKLVHSEFVKTLVEATDSVELYHYIMKEMEE